MNKLFKEYKIVQRSGCIMKLLPVIIAFILPAFTGAIVKAVNLFETTTLGYFIAAIGDFISLMVPIIIISNYSDRKYIMLSSLPIRAKSIIKLVYLQTYVILIVTSLLSAVIYSIAFGMGSVFIELLKLSILLMFSNLVIPACFSPQMDITASNNSSKIVLMVILIFIGVCSGIFTATLNATDIISLLLGSRMFIIISTVLSVLFCTVAYLTIKWSFNKAANKVRLVKG